jgi:hypothetical protein
MTDTERQKLCEWLRGSSVGWSGSSKLSQAAAELERLAIQNKRLKRVVRVREQRRQHDVGVVE